MLESLQELYVGGAEIDWARFDRDYPRRRVCLTNLSVSTPALLAGRGGNQRKAVARHDPENTWRAASTAALRQSRQTPMGVNVGTYVDKWRCLEGLTTAHAVNTLRTLGRLCRPQRSSRRGVDRPAFWHFPNLQAPAAALAGSDWPQQGYCVPRATSLSAADRSRIRIWPTRMRETEQALADDPDLLAYIRNCGEKLPGVITGQESPLETLFPGGSSTLAERLYAGANTNRYANAIAGAAVEAAARTSRDDRSFRILEVGAGTGGTSATLLPLLNPGRSEYVFSDVSDLFLARAREKFAAFPFASLRHL